MNRFSFRWRHVALLLVCATLGLGTAAPLGRSTPPCWAKHRACPTTSTTAPTTSTQPATTTAPTTTTAPSTTTVSTTTATTPSTTTTSTVPASIEPTFGGPSIYLANSPWNTPIPASAPIHPDSATMMTGVWTDSGGHPHAWGPVNNYGYSNWLGPRENVGRTWISLATTPLVTVKLDYPTCGAGTFQVPIPPDLVYHQDFNSSDVEHRTILDLDDGSLWTLYNLTKPGEATISGCPADSNWHVRVVDHRSPGWTGLGDGYQSDGTTVVWNGASAAKTPLDAGLITAQDFQNVTFGGHLNHALNINVSTSAQSTGPVTSTSPHPGFVWPAARGGGVDPSANALPMGARVQFDPTINVSALSIPEWQKVLLRTLQVYGGITTDTAGAEGAGDGLMAQFPGTQQMGSYVFPWVADGHGWSYGNSFPLGLMGLEPDGATPYWRVIDWTKSIPSITARP